MINLDFFLKQNGRVEYTKDISITQYSNKMYTIRLLTKETYDVVNMNVTLPNNINTSKKNLIQQSYKEDGYWVYTYPVDLSITDFEMAAEKATIKLSFFLYPDIDDQSKLITTGLCYLPILRNTENVKPDGSITETDLNIINSKINDINETLSNMNLGELDTAKNYNTNTGNIKTKFDSVDAQIGNIKDDIDLIEKILGSTDSDGGNINTNLKELETKLENLKSADATLNTKISNINNTVSNLKTTVDNNYSTLNTTINTKTSALDSKINNNTNNISNLQKSLNNTNTAVSNNQKEIKDLKENILPSLKTGVKYEIVSYLPTNPKDGVVYLVPNTIKPGTYKEYLYINSKWELIGDTESSVDIDLSGYYTKTEVDDKLSNIDIGNQLTGYAKETYVDNKVSELVNAAPEDLNTLRELAEAIQENESIIDTLNQSISNKADKSELEALEGRVDGIENVSSTYATKEYVEAEINELIGGAPDTLNTLKEIADYIESDISGTATLIEKVDSKADASSVYTKDEVDNKLTDYTTDTGLTEALTDYYTKTETIDKFVDKTDLSDYYTKNETLDVFLKKADEKSRLSQFENDTNYITDTHDAFSYSNLKNIPPRATNVSQLVNDGDGESKFITANSLTNTLNNYITNTKLNTELERVSANETEITNIKSNIDEVESHLDDTTELANTALALAQSKQFSKVFETKADMITFIKTKPTDPISVGTEFIIKEHNVSDYWVSAIYGEPIPSYTTSFGEVFENVYIGVEEMESKLDLGAYATIEYVDNEYDTRIKEYIDGQDALKVDLSAKASVINDSSVDTQWASAKAVKDYVQTVKSAIDISIADNTNKITAVETDAKNKFDNIDIKFAELDTFDAGLQTLLDRHDSQISTLITDLDTVERRTDTAETNITNLTNSVNNKILFKNWVV